VKVCVQVELKRCGCEWQSVYCVIVLPKCPTRYMVPVRIVWNEKYRPNAPIRIL
jgi:hypothetical protein